MTNLIVLLALFAATPDFDDIDIQDAQNHAAAANRLALGDVLRPTLSWPTPSWAFVEMPWISISGIRPSPRVVAASVAAAAVEAAIEYEAIAAASQAAAQSSWQTAIDWIDVADAVKASPKPSPFDSKLSPFDAESNND